MLVAVVEMDARPAVFHVLMCHISDDARAAAAMPHARADSLREDKVARVRLMIMLTFAATGAGEKCSS